MIKAIAIVMIVAGFILTIGGVALHSFGKRSEGLIPPNTTEPTKDVAATKPIKPLPPREELVRLLNAEAAKQGVYWQVWCTAFYEGDAEKFSGIATKGKLLNIYEEDGATDYWSVHGFDSQEAAAYALLQALREAPNHQPMKKDKRKECPIRPLIGTTTVR